MEFNGRARLFNLDENKFEDVNEMNSYPSLLTPPSESPERVHALSSPINNAEQNMYIPSQAFPLQYAVNNSSQGYPSNEAFLQIIEQPVERFRFRYRSEMAGTHGTLTGRSGDRGRKQTYPTVQLCGFPRPAIIRCSVYQIKSDGYGECQPHAHRLVRKSGSGENDDPHEIKVSIETDFVAGFHSMGIIHTARKQVIGELVRKKAHLKVEEIARREGKRRDITAEELIEIEKYAEIQSSKINLNIVRLRFDAFEERNGILYPICNPVYSKNINNLKSAQTCDLKIVRMDHCTSPCRGNREIFILVEKVTKKNIKIRFYELNEEDEVVWEDYGSFNDLDVHHQYAIVFKTPPYRDINCDHYVKVYMELIRPSDGARSEAKEFTYTPCDPITGRKRPRIGYDSGSSFNSYYGNGDIPLTIPGFGEENVVRSDELEEALKNYDITSSEVENLFNAFQGQYKEFVMDTIDESNSLEITDSINQRILNDDEKKIVVGVYRELYSFLKTNPDSERKVRMSIHLFKNFRSPYGDTPFHLSLYGYAKKLLILLLNLLSENPHPNVINAVNSSKDTVLHVAVEMGVVFVVKFLMARNADLTIQNEDGNTPLHLSVKQNSSRQQANTTILNVLLENKRTVKKIIDLDNNDGNTPLAIAIKSKNLLAVRELCKCGADVNKPHKKNGFTPLHMAVYEQNVEIVDFLLNDNNINIQMHDFKDFTPYKLAIILNDENGSGAKICQKIEEHMRLYGIQEIKELPEEVSDEEVVKMEPMSPAEDLDTGTTTSFTPDCMNKVAKYLDESGNWKNLAELLDMEHFLRIEGISGFKSPSKSLLNMALVNGESVERIRDFLENLDEKEAVDAIDRMVKEEKEQE